MFMTFLEEQKNMERLLILTVMETCTYGHGISTMKASGFVNTPNSWSFLKTGEDGSEILALHGGIGFDPMRKSRSTWSNLTLTEDTYTGQFMLTL